MLQSVPLCQGLTETPSPAMGLYIWAEVPWEESSLSDSAWESRRAQVHSCWVSSLRWSHSPLACGWTRGRRLHIHQLLIYIALMFCVGQSWEQQWRKALGPGTVKSVILWETKTDSQMVMLWCSQGKDRDLPQGWKVLSHQQSGEKCSRRCYSMCSLEKEHASSRNSSCSVN